MPEPNHIKASIVQFLKGCTVVCAAFVVLAASSYFWPAAGAWSAMGVIALAGVALLRPLPAIWLANRTTILCVLILAAGTIPLSGILILQEMNAKEKAMQEARAAELRVLRRTDPVTYLAMLEQSKDSRWEGELKVLDPQRYGRLVDERKAQAEAERQKQIGQWLANLKATPAADVEAQYTILNRLRELDPSNKEYLSKYETLVKQLARLREAEALRDLQQKYPERYVKMEAFSWSKGGFDNVMLATFTIKNNLPWPVKDIEVECTHDAPSGTTIDRNVRTIYEKIDAGKSKQFPRFSMGFIHGQAARSGCVVKNVIPIRY